MQRPLDLERVVAVDPRLREQFEVKLMEWERPLQDPAEGLRAAAPYQAVRVLAHRQERHIHVEPGVPKGAHPAERRLLARRIAVVDQHDALDIAPQEPGLLLRQRRPHRRDRVGEPRLMGGDHVEVALDEDELLRLGLPCQVEPVERLALGEERRVGYVEVFRLLLLGVERPPGEADHPAAVVGEGKDHPIAEAVVKSALTPAQYQAQLEERLRVREGLHQVIPAGEGIPQPEPLYSFGLEAPPHQVAAGLCARGARQILLEVTRYPLVQLQQAVVFRRGRPAQLHPGLARQPGDCLAEGEVLDPHQEVEDIAAGAAAEAVEELLLRVDDQAGVLVRMEGAERDIPAPARLQLEVTPQDLDHIDPFADQLYLLSGSHSSPSSRRKGFETRSWAKVVSGPWPGRTR